MKIALTGGGTAGHVTPCLSLLPYLKRSFSHVFYVGSKTGIERELVRDIPFYPVSCARLRRAICLENLKIPFSLLRGIREAKALFLRERPDVLFSKGGFVAVPAVLAAQQLGIPVVLHESDRTMGLANRISAKRATRILTTFAETAKSEKFLFTGPPIRRTLYDGSRARALAKLNLPDRPTVLVTGGSIGSRAINAATREILPKLTEEFNVIHLTGKDPTFCPEQFGYAALSFTPDIADLFAASDIAVTRGGSNTLCELLALGIPSLIIPLPKGESRGDQVENAHSFASRGFAEVLLEKDLSPEALLRSIRSTFENRENLRSAMLSCPTRDGTAAIVREIEKAAGIPSRAHARVF